MRNFRQKTDLEAVISGFLVFFAFFIVFQWCLSPVQAADVSLVNRASGLPADWVTTLAADDSGIWAGTVSGGAALITPQGLVKRVYGTRDGLPSPKIVSIASFGGKVYVGTDAGIGIFDGGTWEILQEASGRLLRNVYMEAEPDGVRLWAGAVNTSGGLLHLTGTGWQFAGGAGRGLMNHVRAFAFQNETVWMGTTNSGVYRRTKNEFRFFTSKDGLPSSSIHSLEIFAGTVWAGTSNGAARYEKGRWKSFPRSSVFPLSAVFCLEASPEALYLGGREGLLRYRSGRFERFSAGEASRSIGRVNALLFYQDALYAGTSSGLYIVRSW
jgi:ligand-binding sensor domain-containing protein